jgi:hypothetical protein
LGKPDLGLVNVTITSTKNREGRSAKNHGVGPRRQLQRQPGVSAAAMKR